MDTKKLGAYLDGLVPERNAELQAMEAYAAEHEFPIIGPAAGQLCYQLARLIGAKRIFELGSGYHRTGRPVDGFAGVGRRWRRSAR